MFSSNPSIVFLKPLSQGSRNYPKEEAEILIEPMVIDDLRKQCFPDTTGLMHIQTYGGFDSMRKT